MGRGHQGPGGRRRGPPGGGSPAPRRPLTLPSLCPDITGPIILQTYRAIADFEKTSGSQMALATGDVVDVVEKSESGQPPRPPGTSLPLVPAAVATSLSDGLGLPPHLTGCGSFGGPDCPPRSVPELRLRAPVHLRGLCPPPGGRVTTCVRQILSSHPVTCVCGCVSLGHGVC